MEFLENNILNLNYSLRNNIKMLDNYVDNLKILNSKDKEIVNQFNENITILFKKNELLEKNVKKFKNEYQNYISLFSTQLKEINQNLIQSLENNINQL